MCNLAALGSPESQPQALTPDTLYPAGREPVSGNSAAAFDAFDAMVEGWLDDESLGRKGRRGSEAEEEAEEEEDTTPTVLCARCYSLKHYG